MVSKRIMKYAVAFRRNTEFGYALGDGELTNPMYRVELARDYSQRAAEQARVMRIKQSRQTG